MLRLDSDARKLSKAERYGHPYERPIHASAIPPDVFRAVVVSFFRHAHGGGGGGGGGGGSGLAVQRKVGWSWADLREFNAAVDWSSWVPESS